MGELPIRKATLDDRYKTLYFGSKNKIIGDSIQLQNDELFVTPFITLASIFAVRPRGAELKLPRGSYNYGYDEWKKPIEVLSQETEPLKEVHIIIEGLPELKPFDYPSSGFIYVIDALDVKDHLYQKQWMDDQREYIVKDLESVPIQQVIPVDIMCHIRGAERRPVGNRIHLISATENDLQRIIDWKLDTIIGGYPGEDIPPNEKQKMINYVNNEAQMYLKNTRMILVNDTIVGMLIAYDKDGDWFIDDIYIIPEYRSHGIGRKILESEIKKHDTLALYVYKSNARAYNLYLSLGFKVIEETGDRYKMKLDKNLQDALPVSEAFFKEAYLKAKERNELEDSKFGIPELRKYPLTDETHIKMAVKFFGKAPKKYKLSLAKRILRAAHSHDMDTKDWDSINDYIKNHKDKTIKESTEMITGYRFTLKDKNVGIYEALKQAMYKKTQNPEAWKTFIGSSVCNWLPKPPGYGNNKSYFTKSGYDMFMKVTMPEVLKYINEDDIKCDTIDIPTSKIVYQDDYQFITGSPIKESYTERKNFIMKEQITKILEAYNSGVLTQEEASTKIEAIQEGAYLQKLKAMANNWDEDYFQAYSKVVDDAYKEVKYGPDGKPENPAKYADWIKKNQFLKSMKALRPKHFEFRNAKEHDDYYNKIAHGNSERAKEMVNTIDANRNKYANTIADSNDNESDSVLGIRESAIMEELREKQEKIMESFKMGIINGTEGMRLMERVLMESDYYMEEDTDFEGDDDDNEPEDITPEDTDGDTIDGDDSNIDALADYINSLSADEKTALLGKISGSDEPTDDDANGNEEVPTDDAEAATEGEPTTEETVDPASISDASLNDSNASLDDMEV